MGLEGRFVWYDVMTNDVEGTKGFYTKLIGWGLQKFEGGGDYEMWVGPKGPQGGVMALPEEAKQMGAPPHWLAYVFVGNVDATVAKAAELGGRTLVPGTDIPGGAGRFAVLQDPQGAVIGVYGGDEGQHGQQAEAQVGGFSWHELATTDAGAAWGFYSALFGWEKTEAMDMGPGGVYQMYGQGGKTYGGIFRKPPEMPVTAWTYYIHVEDCDASTKQAQALGAKLLNGPMDVPGGDRISQLMDPQGAAFALHSSGAAG